MTRHRLSRRTATTTRFSPKGIGCQKQTAPRYCQHPIRWAFTSQAFTRWHHLNTHLIKQACYSFIDPRRMKGWVGLVGWPVADGLPKVVTRQLQAECRTGSVRRPNTGIPPTALRMQHMHCWHSWQALTVNIQLKPSVYWCSYRLKKLRSELLRHWVSGLGFQWHQ